MSVSSDLLPATTLVWRPRGTGYVLTAIAKATISLEPGEGRLAQEQEPICEVDGHWDDNPTRSLFIASDVTPQKPRADVVAVGHAFAGQGKRARQLVARLQVGSIDKSIEVTSDRSVGPDGTIYDGGTFARMPIVYERAAGGPGTWNPVGIGRDDRDRNGNARLPNLQAKGLPPNARIEPIGFGPIAPSWRERAERLGSPTATLSPTWATEPLAESMDLGFFNMAPRDQQLDKLDEGAPIVLENLHPEHARLSTRLPTLRPKATFEVRGTTKTVAMVPDTLWIDTDRGLCTVTYRAQINLDQPDERHRVRIELGGKSERPPKRRLTPTDMFAVENAPAGALPFGKTTGTSPQPTQPAMPAVDAASWMTRNASTPPPAASSRQTVADTGLPWEGAPATAATPFTPAKRSQAITVQQPVPQPPTQPPGAMQSSAMGNQTMAIPSPLAQQMGVPPVAAQPLVPQMAAPQMPAPQMPAPQMPAPQMSAPQMSAPQMSAPQMSAPQMHAPPMHAPPLAPVARAGAAIAAGAAFAAASSVAAEPAWAPSPWAQGAQGPTHAKSAALSGVVGASNAAADLRADGSLAQGQRKPRGTAMQLLWFDPDILPRVRRKKPWKELIDELDASPYDADLDEPAPGETAADIEDRREVNQVVALGNPSGETAVELALDDGVRDDGKFVSPLLLVAGELTLGFDELETLKAVVSIATPLATGDEELKNAVGEAVAYLSVPGLVSSADVAQSLTTKIRETFARGKRAVPATYLDTESERALLEKRAYQKRNVFGGPHLRALFFFAGSTTGIPTYLPEALAQQLPLFRRFAVKLIADVAFQADQFESHPTALKVGAIARMIAPRA
jgi:hypothetical protein